MVEILNLVRLGRASTRLEIEQHSEYGRAVIADRVGSLAEKRLIDESATGIASGGRAPRLIRFEREVGAVIAAAIEPSSISVGLSDLSGTLLTEHHDPIDPRTEVNEQAERLLQLVSWMVSHQGAKQDVWAISISVPHPVAENACDSFLSHTPDVFPGWSETCLVEKLTRQFEAPVLVSSNVKTLTVGEMYGGIGQGLSDFIYVKTGRSFSVGLVLAGVPYSGGMGLAGLIGQLPVTRGERTDTLDALAAAGALETKGLSFAKSGDSHHLQSTLKRTGAITINDVCQAAQLGDRVCMDALSESGRMVGGILATLVNVLNPQLVALGGTLSQTNDLFLAAVRQAIYGASHPLATSKLKIERSKLSSSAGLLGAARICTEALFAPEFMREWIMQGTPKKHHKLQAFLNSSNADKRFFPSEHNSHD